MAYTKENYEDVEPLAPGMYFLRNDLDCENLGVTVLDVGAGWNGKTHDHADDRQEEVYLLLDGSGTLNVEGEEIPLEPGDAVRVEPDATRQLSFAEKSTMVIVGAP